MRKPLIIACGLVVVIVILGYFASRILFDDDGQPPEPPPGVVEVVDAGAAPPEPAGDSDSTSQEVIAVVSVSGDVQHRLGDGSWSAVKTGDVLRLDEAIRTGEDGNAVLAIGEGATVKIAPGSEFSVKEITQTVAGRLEEGRIAATVSDKTGSRLEVEAKGSDAVAESAGGEFSMLADGLGQVAVATQEGSVRVSARGQTVEVLPGNQSVVQPGLAPSDPAPIPDSLFLKVARPRSLKQRARQTVVKGTTAPGAVVSVNRVRFAVGDDGSFVATVALREGTNPITVMVEDVTGRSQAKQMPAVTVDSRPPDVTSDVKWGGGGGPKPKGPP